MSAQVLRLRGNRGVITDNAINNTWSHSPDDMVKINVDASWKTNGNLGFIGVVVRDSNSRCLAVRRRAIRAISCAAVEVLNVLKECLLAQQHGFTKVVVESDLNEVISWLNMCIENGCWEAFPSMCKIRQLGKSFHACI